MKTGENHTFGSPFHGKIPAEVEREECENKIQRVILSAI